ncbi:MAG: hypothetical protein ACLQCB_07535 [Spirochaetia bacterium]
MRIDNQYPQMMPASAAAAHSLREAPGELEQDGDADDRGKVAAQPKSMNQIQNDTLGKNIDVLA